MNLLEAIKTGKPFRRKAWGPNAIYAFLTSDGRRFIDPEDDGEHTFDKESWLADDWEIRHDPAHPEFSKQVYRRDVIILAEKLGITGAGA